MNQFMHKRSALALAFALTLVAGSPSLAAQTCGLIQTRVRYGDPVRTHSITAVGQQHCFNLSGSKQQLVRLEFSSVRSNFPNPAFATLRIRDKSSGKLVTGCLINTNGILQCTLPQLPQNGDYQIEVLATNGRDLGVLGRDICPPIMRVLETSQDLPNQVADVLA